MWIHRLSSPSSTIISPAWVSGFSPNESLGLVLQQASSEYMCQFRTYLNMLVSYEVACKKWWVTASEHCSPLNCLPGALESRWVWEWPQWSEVIWCYCQAKRCRVTVQVSKPISRACINPEGMLQGWTWFQLTADSSLEKKVRTREACNEASSDHGASVGNVKSKAVSLSRCSASGLQSITNYWNNDLKILLSN